MRTIQLLLALMLLTIAGGGSAWANDHGRHGHGHGHGHGHLSLGIVIGPSWEPWHYRPYGYPYPYYHPSVIVTRAPPPVYVEQAPAQQSNYWYYCNASRAYYPYVKECPGGWQQVVPQPPQP